MKIRIKKIRNQEKVKNERKWKEKKSEGFTFVETIAVLAIGAILTAGSTVSATKLIRRAKQTAAKNQISEFSAALQTYFLDCGCFPTTEQGIKSLWEKPSLYPVPENWNGPYVMREPGADPWGTEYEYVNAENANVRILHPFLLKSIILFVLGRCTRCKAKAEECHLVATANAMRLVALRQFHSVDGLCGGHHELSVRLVVVHYHSGLLHLLRCERTKLAAVDNALQVFFKIVTGFHCTLSSNSITTCSSLLFFGMKHWQSLHSSPSHQYGEKPPQLSVVLSILLVQCF